MELLIAGTVTLDTIEVEGVRNTDQPGGSALFAGAAASRVGPCRLVGVAGRDFPSATLEALEVHGADTSGISQEGGRSFRWHARYENDLDERETLSREPGAGLQPPRVPTAWRDDSHVVLLGSMDPAAQADVLGQIARPALLGVDTMHHWIEARRREVIRVVRKADVLFVDEREALLLGDAGTLRQAATVLLGLGPRIVVVKRGSRGVCMLREGRDEVERPAVDVPRVVDPTGAGDALAGGFMSVLRSDPSLGEEVASRALDAGVRSAALAIRDLSFTALLAAPAEKPNGPMG